MHVRSIAMAVLLVSGTGIACTHSRSERSGGQTATSDNNPATASQPSGQGQPSTISESPDSSTSPYSSQDTSGSPGASGAYGSSSGSSDSSLQAHSDDQVVSGTIARISRRTVTIQSDAGDQKSLLIVPETAIEVDGQDAQRSDLREGQDVRASFNDENGRDVAVTIQANEAGSSSSRLHDPGQGTVQPGDAGSPASPSTPDRPGAGVGPSEDDPAHPAQRSR